MKKFKRVALWLVGLTLPGLLLAACGDTPTATPIGPTPTAAALPTAQPAALVEQAGQDFTGLQSLHLLLDIRQGKTEVNGIEVKKVEGDIEPGKYQAQVQVQVFVAGFSLPVIGLGHDQYMKDDLGNWGLSKPEQIVNLAGLLDPQNGLGPTLRKLNQPRLIGQETLPGNLATYHIQGDLSGPDVAVLTFNKLGKHDVTFDVWISQDSGNNRVRQLYIKEKGTDPALSIWALNFSNFNQPLNIQKPTVK